MGLLGGSGQDEGFKVREKVRSGESLFLRRTPHDSIPSMRHLRRNGGVLVRNIGSDEAGWARHFRILQLVTAASRSGRSEQGSDRHEGISPQTRQLQ